MTSTDAFTLARRKAKYSQYDWIIWKNKEGDYCAERATSASIKAALLSVGTQGHFSLIQSRTAWSNLMGWRTGINAMQWAKRSEMERW